MPSIMVVADNANGGDATVSWLNGCGRPVLAHGRPARDESQVVREAGDE
jgi:hypothetical protein